MNLALYSAATGMQAQQLNLNNIANNISNVNTPGYKRQKVEFQDILYQTPEAAGGDTGSGSYVPVGIEMGNGTKVSATGRVYTQGELTQTDAPLDLAIEGAGFFEIEKPDGTTAFTRDGSFKLNSDGEVVTSDGYRVLSGFQTIPTDSTGVYVSSNGYVTVETPSADQTFRLELTRFANPAGLKSLGSNLFEETLASGSAEVGNPDEAGFGGINQGYLELSNVNIVEEMVNMIVAQRSYEINSKSIQTADEMLSRVNQLKR